MICDFRRDFLLFFFSHFLSCRMMSLLKRFSEWVSDRVRGAKSTTTTSSPLSSSSSSQTYDDDAGWWEGGDGLLPFYL